MNAQMQGLECPRCGCPESQLVKVRTLQFSRQGRTVVRRLRRRECVHCRARFTTREEVLPGSLVSDR